MASSIFCPIDTRPALEAAADALVKHLAMPREEAFAKLLHSFGILGEHVDDEIAEGIAESLRQQGFRPAVKADEAVLRPPRARACLGFQVRANVLRVFDREGFEDLPRSSLLLISVGQVVVRRAATAPRKQASDVKTIFHDGAGTRGAAPEAGPQGAAMEQRIRHFLDLYAAPGAELRHLRADRDEISFKAILDQSSNDVLEDFQRFLELLDRYCGPMLSVSDKVFHGVPDFDRYNKFLLNYPTGA